MSEVQITLTSDERALLKQWVEDMLSGQFTPMDGRLGVRELMEDGSTRDARCCLGVLEKSQRILPLGKRCLSEHLAVEDTTLLLLAYPSSNFEGTDTESAMPPRLWMERNVPILAMDVAQFPRELQEQLAVVYKGVIADYEPEDLHEVGSFIDTDAWKRRTFAHLLANTNDAMIKWHPNITHNYLPLVLMVRAVLNYCEEAKNKRRSAYHDDNSDDYI